MTDETGANEDTPRKTYSLPDEVIEMDLPWEPERYDVDGCAIEERDGTVSYPFEGQSVWLSPYTPASLTEAGMQFTASGTAHQGGAFARLRRGLSKVVVWHDLIDPQTGGPMPQFWNAPEVFEDAPSALLFYLWSLAVSGEPPDERPKGSRRGSRGGSTRRSTARKSKS